MADPESAESSPVSESARQQLSLWDTVSVVIGIVVGVSIFKVPGTIFQNVESPLAALGVWLLGAVVAFCGALSWAELCTQHRRGGGEYVFLSEAYGPIVGFLFGWAQLAGVFSGAIGSMAYVFADYSAEFFGAAHLSHAVLAALAVCVLTVFHILGVRTGKAVQNLLTIAKLGGLSLLLVIGLSSDAGDSLTDRMDVSGPGIGLAMIMILYAFGGWNDSSFVAAEVKNPARNVPRALIISICLITAIYVLMNFAYFRGLGFAGLRDSQTPASDLVAQSTLFGDPAAAGAEDWTSLRSLAGHAISLLVMISALGAVHGLIFTGSRLYAALGEDHAIFARLGQWHPTRRSPATALSVQAILSVLLILAVGTERGQAVVDVAVGLVGRDPIPWQQFGGGFDALIAATATVFWSFFLLSGLSLFVSRFKHPRAERPFRVPGYPIPPLIFCASCVFMIRSSIDYAGDLTLLALLPLACGLPMFLLSRRLDADRRPV